jgi:hypothetical protein
MSIKIDQLSLNHKFYPSSQFHETNSYNFEQTKITARLFAHKI